ncbi:AsmA family protein [Kangiella sediminilitoris]|uniref:Uncharacterized protein n=1 Tax=Kangiella sediminilitoris TaxID=1144748 RepID=A0A1B3B9Q3_9GAMM|nr:AsmA-like C-terminal region-containing protein [Kangiella sediminilitoris]AOE49541.1 hypothetical protein KS2013_818 [Kangiella sediminilitoris]
MTKSWKWLKRIIWVLSGLFVLLFLAVSFLVYLVNSESYLEGYITENLGVEAKVGELDVSLLSGTINIESSVIGPADNPFIQFESLKAELDYSELWSSRLTVQQVELNQAKLRYPFEFKTQQGKSSEEGDSSLFFDFINVSAIDINNLDFVYEDGLDLIVQNANVKIRDLPVAEEGFLLFEDLSRLVKASTTKVEATIGAVKSDKSQLNQLQLQAHIENEQLIIDDVVSGQSEVTINVLDYSDSQQAQVPNSNSSEKPLDLPFSDVTIRRVMLGKTDLTIQDKETISIRAVEAQFNELLLIKNKKALWLDWPEFYQTQNSHFTVSSKVFQSDLLGYDSLELEGALNNGEFQFPKFKLIKPVVRISDTEGSGEAAKASTDTSIFLPFETATLIDGSIESGTVEVARGAQTHRVSNVDLKLKTIPFILNNRFVLDDQSLDLGSGSSNVQLDSAQYEGAYGRVENVASQIMASGSDVTIKKLNLEKPEIKYVSEVSHEKKSEGSDTESSTFPLNSISIDSVSITGAGFDITANEQNYAGSGIKFNATNLPVYGQSEWLIAKPNQWQKQSDITIDASSLKLPQGTLGSLFLQSTIEDKNALVSRLDLERADISIVAPEGGYTASSAESLPINTIELQNITLNNTNLSYRQAEEDYVVTGADIKLQYLPLVKDGNFITEPQQFMTRSSNRMDIRLEQLDLPQGQVRGIAARGNLQNQDLMLDSLTARSADLTLTVVPADDELTSDKKTLDESPFAFRTVKVGDLKLQNIDVTVSRQVGEEQQLSEINNLYLGATELMLAKNFQTIEQWYSSQLENAFALIALRVEHIKQNQNDIRGLTVTAVQSDQRIRVQPLRFIFNETPLKADWTIELSQQPYKSTFISKFNDLELSKLFEPATERSVTMSGQLDGDIGLVFDGLTQDSIFSSIDGSLLVKNQTPVTIHRLNVNKILRSFLDSQKFGLLDIGGFLLAGPLGLLVSQGVSLQDTVSQLGADEGDTLISALNIEMSLKDGVLTTKDVAAATRKYRFAFNGQINLAKQEFNDFEFDVINEKGCSEYGQTLNGSLSSPEVETFTAAFDAVTGSVIGLIKQGVGLLTGGACSSVYKGVVPHPKEGVEIIPQDRRQIINEDQGEDEDKNNLE